MKATALMGTTIEGQLLEGKIVYDIILVLRHTSTEQTIKILAKADENQGAISIELPL